MDAHDVLPAFPVEGFAVGAGDLLGERDVGHRHRLREVFLEDELQPKEKRLVMYAAARLDIAEDVAGAFRILQEVALLVAVGIEREDAAEFSHPGEARGSAHDHQAP